MASTRSDPETYEAERIAELRRWDLLDTPGEAAFDLIADMAARFFGTAIGVVSLVDVDRQWFKASVGLDMTETPRSSSFCHYTIQSDEVLVIEDATLDDRFREHPCVVADPWVRFYAGAPLIMTSGMRIGAICVVDTKPRSLPPTGAADFLEGLARRTVELIEARRHRERNAYGWPDAGIVPAERA